MWRFARRKRWRFWRCERRRCQFQTQRRVYGRIRVVFGRGFVNENLAFVHLALEVVKFRLVVEHIHMPTPISRALIPRHQFESVVDVHIRRGAFLGGAEIQDQKSTQRLAWCTTEIDTSVNPRLESCLGATGRFTLVDKRGCKRSVLTDYRFPASKNLMWGAPSENQFWCATRDLLEHTNCAAHKHSGVHSCVLHRRCAMLVNRAPRTFRDCAMFTGRFEVERNAKTVAILLQRSLKRITGRPNCVGIAVHGESAPDAVILRLNFVQHLHKVTWESHRPIIVWYPKG